MQNSKPTVAQLWMAELSLVAPNAISEEGFDAALRAVLAINPALAMDQKALYFAVQGWLAAKLEAAN